MKNLNIIIVGTLLIILSFLGLKTYLDFYFLRNSKNEEQILIKESLRVLNECFDFENKNKRTLNKSIELIEFCLDEYGYKKY